MKIRSITVAAALGLAMLPVTPSAGQDEGAEACSPSSGWSSRVARFRSQSIEKQLKKVDFDDGVISTHGMGARRFLGIIDGRLRSFLQYRPIEDGPQYRLVLDENYQDGTHVNYHYAYTVELMVDGEYIELAKAGQEGTFPMCGADNSCTSQMVSYYIVPAELFERIEAMPETVLMPLRIRRDNTDYRVCRDYMPAAEFRLLRSAIARGDEG